MKEKLRDLLEELDKLQDEYENSIGSNGDYVEGFVDGVEEVKNLIYLRLLD